MQPQYFRKRRRGTKRSRIGKVASEYRPLVGTWLIEIAILLDWHRPTKFGKWPDIFSDEDFLALTGIPDPYDTDDDDEDETSAKIPTAKNCLKMLEKHLAALQKVKVPDRLALFDNLKVG